MMPRTIHWDGHGNLLCTICREYKSVDNFGAGKSIPRQGYSYYCRSCTAIKRQEWRATHSKNVSMSQRAGSYRRLYGITLNDYNNLLSQQDNSCAICETHISNGFRELDVDHDHETGKVRGLLCHNCNKALGHFKENIEVMRAAILYLERNSNGD